MDALVGDIFGGRADALLERLHEGVAAGRQDEVEAMVAPTGQARGKTIRAVFEPLDRRLHALCGLGMNARTAIEDAIDGREADPGRPRNILERLSRH